MKTAIYFCNCGSNITERIDFSRVAAELEREPGVAFVKSADFLCSEDQQNFLEADLKAERPDRVVIAACSPREYESTFMRVLERSGMNPYFLQMANIREQVAWVTPDPEQATRKACRQIRAAAARAARHQPLEKTTVEASRDVVVIGAGPAGLKCALALAEAGRQVVLVEKTPVLGGLPVRYEELFPNMECGPCMLEPLLGEVMHGPHAGNILILTFAEIAEVTGYYGNFTLRIRQAPRFVDTEKCIGCGECIPVCPVSVPNEFNFGLDQRKAIALPFLGALPNVPFLDTAACLRSQGDACTLCSNACPVEDAFRFDDAARTIERTVGAIVVAIGGSLYDCSRIPELGYGKLPSVRTSVEFERMLASNGPSDGELLRPDGSPPENIAIVHCVGSLDEGHRPYCSGLCCEYAFKFNRLIEKKVPGAAIYHLYKELVVPGKEDFALYRQARANPSARFLRYRDSSPLRVTERSGKTAVEFEDSSGKPESLDADLVVLCPAVTGAEGAAGLSALLDAPCDRFGFFEELHGRADSAQSKIKGVYLAGACQAPMDIQHAMNQGMACAGYILSGLADGRKLEVEPITASVDEARCAACRICGSVCPYKAITYPPDRHGASVNALLCHGCGTCVAACPAGAIRGNHFTNEQVLAEVEALLQ
jgi:heterodisulfide reductase subunit A